jgi:hypothetical protein
MPVVKDHFDLASPKQHVVSSSLTNPTGIDISSKELIGIEVEVENIVELGETNNAWNNTTDGSLRNNGAEFVSLPIAACDAPAILNSLMVDTLRASACFSPRTSVHVHMNFANDQLETALDVLLMYCVFERLFYKFVGRQRIKSIYCVPVTETEFLKNIGISGFNPARWEKYTGLNARPLAQYGTLEFRHMHGTSDVRKLSIWIDLITRLKTFCLKQGTKNIRALIAAMNDDFNFKGLLDDIFGHMSMFMKYESIEDVRFTYTTTKLALCKKTASVELASNYNKQSKFFQLRNL